MGVNSAFEDVMVLNDCLNDTKDNVTTALKLFSARRGKEAEALVSISRRLDGGFLTFVLPLILDKILSEKLPRIFAPNTITLLQNENLLFTQVRNRKRLDRVMQVALLGVVLSYSFLILRFAIYTIAGLFKRFAPFPLFG